eukprot:11604492-Karenia_brevis.AAC.1
MLSNAINDYPIYVTMSDGGHEYFAFGHDTEVREFCISAVPPPSPPVPAGSGERACAGGIN